MECTGMNLIAATPLFLVWLAGLVVCVRNIRTRPKVSCLSAAALVMAAASQFLLPIAALWLGTTFLSFLPVVPWQTLAVFLIYHLGVAATWVLVLWIIFVVKEPARTATNAESAEISV